MQELTAAEQTAVRVALDVYRKVGRSPALDGTDHWERFANRIKSSAVAAPTGMAFVEQCGRRFGVAHINGPEITRFLAAPALEQQSVLRALRHESNPVSVLVRALRDEQKEA